MDKVICVKLNMPQGVFDILIGDADPDMIVCKNEEEAERSLYQEYLGAVYEIRNQYHQAVNKIRGIK